MVLALVAIALPATAQDDPAVPPDDTTVPTDPTDPTVPPVDPTVPAADPTVPPDPDPVPAPEPAPAPAPTEPTDPEAEPTDSYGDLWVILRDVDGVPILDANGCVQPYDLEGNLIALDAECALPEGVVAQEVDFGRLNIGRSPTDVLDRQYADVLATLLAGQPLHLDEAGRVATVDGTVIDSPAGNLSIHRQLARGQDLAGVTLPTPNGDYDDYDTMAATLGAAADKAGLLTIDLIEYNNDILGIPEVTTLPTIDRSGGTYLDYRGFTYDRAATFPGCVRYEVDEFSGYHTESIMDSVFGGVDYTGSNVAGFAQAADDARRVIEMTHLVWANVSFVDRVYESGRFGSCPPEPLPTMFTDVNEAYWAADAIVWLGDNDYAAGFPDGTFLPARVIYRGEATVWLYRIAGEPDVSALPPLELVDVPLWMQPAVRWAVGNGFAVGFDDDTYRPYGAMTRAQLARMMYRIVGSPTGSPANTFPDVPTWADPAVDWLTDPAHDPVYATGYRDGTFRPNVFTTRAQAASWMYNARGELLP